MAYSQDIGQGHPETTTDWDRASAAIDGGVAVSDAVFPAPDPVRNMAAEHRKIWEALSTSSWDNNSYYTASVVLEYENPSEISGQMSDETEYSIFINSFDHVSFAESLELTEGTGDFDFILEHMISVAFVNGLVSTVHGDVLVEGLYIDWYEGEDRPAIWLPLVRPDSLIFASSSGPGQCTGCQYREPLEECFDDAMTARDRCLRNTWVIGGAGTIAGFFGGVWPGIIIASGTVTAAGFCHSDYYEDVEECLADHTANWFLQGRRYHWDLN